MIEQNEYAETVDQKSIYIEDAVSGAQGYYCIGCKHEMQAVKSKIFGRRSYFRHLAKNVNQPERQCTFSNQDYRHTQAANILNRIKRIKVPALYKYPPKNTNGRSMKLRDAQFIEAKYTQSELTFYETETGNILFGKNPQIEIKNHLIRPDVTFFNAQNEPILFIEIVVTHKIDQNKLAKIRRLGIDTVQVTIPKDSLENIENSFKTTNHIKWVYNHEQENTDYIYVPERSTEGISRIDELQRKYFEESFECRKSQINNLIRTIEKCLGSEHYRKIEHRLRSEISRVSQNSERTRKELEKYRTGIRNRVSERFNQERTKIRSEKEGIRDEYRRFKDFIKEETRKYETRYNTKRESIKREQENIDKTIQQLKLENPTERIRTDIQTVRNKISRTDFYIKDDLEYRQRIQENFERDRIEEQSRYIEVLSGLAREEELLPEEFEQKRRDLEGAYQQIGEGILRAIKERDTSSPSELSRRIKNLLEAERIFADFQKTKSHHRRNRAAFESFRKRAYKNWV